MMNAIASTRKTAERVVGLRWCWPNAFFRALPVLEKIAKLLLFALKYFVLEACALG
jgi:hypothetical protein